MTQCWRQKPHQTISRSLSLSGACQEDVAASMSVPHAGLSQARRLADARPKLSGRRSSSTVLSQVCLGLQVLRLGWYITTACERLFKHQHDITDARYDSDMHTRVHRVSTESSPLCRMHEWTRNNYVTPVAQLHTELSNNGPWHT